jgi:hypothetical protein
MVRASFVELQSTAHANAAARLSLRLADLTKLETQTAQVDARLASYRSPIHPSLDTRPQLISELREIAAAIQFLRTVELPALLATTPEDAYMSTVMAGLFSESGIPGIHPVASLHQGSWFATIPSPAQCPLMLAPVQVLTDAGELALFFHEIGHVLYRLWEPAFDRMIGATVRKTVGRLALEAANAMDPKDRLSRAEALHDWEPQAYGQMEEIACDLVGALLGGPAFAVALHVALLIPDATPFIHTQPEYPPLDVRMRLAAEGIRALQITDAAVGNAEMSWKDTVSLYSATKPRFYDWLYSPASMVDLATTVAGFLSSNHVSLFAWGCGGIREELSRGSRHLLAGGPGYQRWSNALVGGLRSTYATFIPGGSSASPP